MIYLFSVLSENVKYSQSCFLKPSNVTNSWVIIHWKFAFLRLYIAMQWISFVLIGHYMMICICLLVGWKIKCLLIFERGESSSPPRSFLILTFIFVLMSLSFLFSSFKKMLIFHSLSSLDATLLKKGFWFFLIVSLNSLTTSVLLIFMLKAFS